MLIPEVDFSGADRALGAESPFIRSLSDLTALQDWIDAGAKGTFVRRLPGHIQRAGALVGEWMNAMRAAKAAAAR